MSKTSNGRLTQLGMASFENVDSRAKTLALRSWGSSTVGGLDHQLAIGVLLTVKTANKGLNKYEAYRNCCVQCGRRSTLLPYDLPASTWLFG